MKHFLLSVILYSISYGAFSSSTICEVEKTQIGVKSLTWNSVTLSARVTDELNTIHEGKVSLITEHRPYGVKTNIFIDYIEPYYGADAAEYVVFPTRNGQFRVIGSRYIVNNGKLYLSSSLGNYSAKCIEEKI